MYVGVFQKIPSLRGCFGLLRFSVRIRIKIRFGLSQDV